MLIISCFYFNASNKSIYSLQKYTKYLIYERILMFFYKKK